MPSPRRLHRQNGYCHLLKVTEPWLFVVIYSLYTHAEENTTPKKKHEWVLKKLREMSSLKIMPDESCRMSLKKIHVRVCV